MLSNQVFGLSYLPIPANLHQSMVLAAVIYRFKQLVNDIVLDTSQKKPPLIGWNVFISLTIAVCKLT